MAHVGELELLVPFSSVVACVECEDSCLRGAAERRSLELEGRLVPAIDLRVAFGEAKAGKGRGVAMICGNGTSETGLIVDEVGDARSLELKRLESRLAASPGIAGYAIGEDASILLVLDVTELISSGAS